MMAWQLEGLVGFLPVTKVATLPGQVPWRGLRLLTARSYPRAMHKSFLPLLSGPQGEAATVLQHWGPERPRKEVRLAGATISVPLPFPTPTSRPLIPWAQEVQSTVLLGAHEGIVIYFKVRRKQWIWSNLGYICIYTNAIVKGFKNIFMEEGIYEGKRD